MNQSFREFKARRQELEDAILGLIQVYEAATGWRVTQVEYCSDAGRVISEGVPLD